MKFTSAYRGREISERSMNDSDKVSTLEDTAYQPCDDAQQLVCLEQQRWEEQQYADAAAESEQPVGHTG